MTTEDDINNYISKLERCLLGSESDTSEAQHDVNELWFSPNHNKSPSRSPSSGAKKKRKRQLASNNLTRAKGKCTKIRRLNDDIGQSSVSQQSEPKRKQVESIKELIKKKSVSEVIKVLEDRVNRRIKNDKIVDLEVCLSVLLIMMSNKMFEDQYPSIVDSLLKIKRQWPVRADLQDIKKKIKQIKDTGMATMEGTDKLKQTLIGLEEWIDRSDKQRQKDSKKANNLDELFFTDKEVSVETLREKLSSAFPWIFWEEIATNGPTSNQDQGSSQTCELSQFIVEDFKNFKSKLIPEDRKAETSDFQSLTEATEKTTGCRSNVPDCLKPIAIRIEKARRKPTAYVHENAKLLVCAAIEEMERMPLKDLDERMLSTWGAALRDAREIGFQVDFAEILFEKNLYAYYFRSKLDDTNKVSENRG